MIALNAEQQSAVNARGHVLVVSVPGSGKTRLLVNKADDLLREDQSTPIVLVTFTRDAAAEIESRLRGMVGSLPKSVQIGTFHSLCGTIMRNNGRRYKLLPAGVQASLLFRAKSAMEHEFPTFESAGKAIEHLKSQIDPVIAENSANGRLYRIYQTLLDEHKGIDFADLLRNTVLGMRDGSLKPLPCRHLLIDESQDVDPVQVAWVQSHIDAGAIVTMVGDDDQSIYAWRSALGYRGMVEFEQTHRAQRVVMAANYRSGKEILRVADRLIRHNSERLDKTLRATSDDAGIVQYRQFGERNEEAAAVVEAIRDIAGDWAVLARTNFQLDAVEAKVRATKMPYKRVGSSQFWSRPHVAKVLATLDAVATGNHHGYEPLLALAGISEEDIRTLRPVNPDKIALAHMLLPAGERSEIRALAAQLPRWHDLFIDGETVDLVTGVCEWYRPRMSGKRIAYDLGIARSVLNAMPGSLESRIELLTSPPPKPRNTEDRRVTLLTLHAAKGLEFANCWILGMEEGILPHADNANISEERRLCYVGMTRARQRLILSTGDVDAERSRFLREAGLVADMTLNPAA